MADFITVTELNRHIENLFKEDVFLKNFWVKGEILGFRLYRQSGHMYFTLKDEEAQISCVMFKSRNRKLDFIPQDGQEVLIRGYVSLFSPQGKYQIYVEEMQPYGIGGLFLYLEELKADLAQKGYFDLDKKKAIPKIVHKVGIVTSQDGAAFHDIVRVLKSRHAGVEIILAHSSVQGEEAPREVAKAIRLLNEYEQVELIIVGRGGGSFEDLMAFNSREVVEAIYESKIPIISAVGHEIDFTLSDLAADVRATTPTQAAQLAVAEMELLAREINLYRERLINSVLRHLDYRTEQLDKLMMHRVWQSPSTLIEERAEKLILTQKDMGKAIINHIDKKSQKLNILVSTLDALSPLKVMQRGYAIFRLRDKLISTINEVKAGDEATVQMTDGKIEVVVIGKEQDV